MKVSHNFHRRKNRYDNKTAEAVWKIEMQFDLTGSFDRTS